MCGKIWIFGIRSEVLRVEEKYRRVFCFFSVLEDCKCFRDGVLRELFVVVVVFNIYILFSIILSIYLIFKLKLIGDFC